MSAFKKFNSLRQSKRIAKVYPIPNTKKQKRGVTLDIDYSYEPLDFEPTRFIPEEIWVNHIIPNLGKFTKKILRSTCRTFLFIIAKTCKFDIDACNLAEFLEFKKNVCPKWPTQIYSVVFCEQNYQRMDLSILCALTNLQQIDFYGYSQYLSDADFKYLPYSLTRLNIDHCTYVSNALATHLNTKIRDLSIGGCLKIKCDDNLRFSSLTKLNITGCKNVTNGFLENLPTSLTILNISDSECFGNYDINHFPKALTRLNISNNRLLTSTGLRPLINFSNITTLNISACNRLNNEGMKYLPPNLLKLDVSDCGFLTDIGLKNLPSKLLDLDISSCLMLRDTFPKFLPTMLTKLTVQGLERLDGDLFNTLPKNLKHIDLSHSLGLTAAMNNLKHLTELKKLVLCDSSAMLSICNGYIPSSLTKLDLSLCKLPKSFNIIWPLGLEKLDLSECQYLGRHTIENLPSTLQHLQLSDSKCIDDEFIRALPKCLIKLRLSNCPNLTHNFLSFLPKKLKILMLTGTSLSMTDLIDHLPSHIVSLYFKNRWFHDPVVYSLSQYITEKRKSLITRSLSQGNVLQD